jgi:hypothetical protein
LHRKRGFTITEMVFVSALSVAVVGVATSALIDAIHVWNQEGVVSELRMDLQLSLDWMKRDMRLSSVGVGHMAFYPAEASEYTAISFPRSVDSDDDGLLDRDAEGALLWNQTVIYHIRNGTPDKFLRTNFSPRDMDATPAERYEQLVAVVASTSGAQVAAAAMSGETAQTKTIFENLVDMRILPPDISFDGYAATNQLTGLVNWGSVVLDDGTHELVFTIHGKNANSSGYKIGIDSIALSHSQSARDGELFAANGLNPDGDFYLNTNVGGAVVANDMSMHGASWNGKAQLTYNALAVSNQITLLVDNDMWSENNFDLPAATLASNVSVRFMRDFTNVPPYIPDYVVTMDRGSAWRYERVAEGDISVEFVGETIAVTNMILGGTNAGTGISMNGKWARLRLASGDSAPLYVTNLVIIDVASGAASNVFFGGKPDFFIGPREDVWSDWVPNFEIDEWSSYAVAMQVGGRGDNDIDMFVGGNDGKIRYYENVGTPSFPAWGGAQNGWQGIDVGTFSQPAFADIDMDGDADLFVGDHPIGMVEFHVNIYTNTTPNMVLADADWNAIRDPWSRPTFADLDADGDLDCFVGGKDGRITYIHNIGTPWEPDWDTPDTFWEGIDIDNDGGAGIGQDYSTPTFVDIDGDHDLDLFIGRSSPGTLIMFENTGTPSNYVWGATNDNYAGLTPGPYAVPTFVDIDDDGDSDLFCGNAAGKVVYFRNTGSPTNAVWGYADYFYNGISVGNFSSVAFANINPDKNSILVGTNADVALMTTNGGPVLAVAVLAEIEVGYPDEGVYRSGVFDTSLADPDYQELNWTQVENFSSGWDVDVRVRSAADKDQILSTAWTDANPSSDGYFQGNVDNDLSTLPKDRYVQYEARFRCFSPPAHTSEVPGAILRDLTLDWEGEQGIVDLRVALSKGPDYGIIGASVDGQSFIRGISVELAIFKYSRPFGTNTVRGRIEVKPLNTGH